MKISSNLSIINLNFPQQYLIHGSSFLRFDPPIYFSSHPQIDTGGAVRKNAFVTLHSSVGAPLNCAPTKNPSLNWDGGLGPYFLWPLCQLFYFYFYSYYYYYFHSALVPILIKSGSGTCAATEENLLLQKHREKRTMESIHPFRFFLWSDLHFGDPFLSSLARHTGAKN